MRGEPGVDRVRARGRARPPRRRVTRRALLKPSVWALAVAIAVTVGAGAVFAGSGQRIADGVRVAGVDVGGLTVAGAEKLLAERAAGLRSVPVVFTVGERRFPLTPRELDVRVDWGRTAEAAREAGDGPFPFRGLKRIKVRLFGVDVEPRADLYDAALDFRLGEIEREVSVQPREAALVLRGLRPAVVPSRVGRKLDLESAERRVAFALAGFSRAPVPLPVAELRPRVETRDLAPVVGQVHTALSGPVQFGHEDTHWRIRPRELATLLLLPAGGREELRIGGPAARRYFHRLSRAVDRVPRDADFVAEGARVRLVPAAVGRRLDVPATADELLAAALSSEDRDAKLVVLPLAPNLTTDEARRFGITRVLGSFATPYSGTADRIRNLRLAVSLLDRTLIGPGKRFSFNHTVGPRTRSRGFRPAPVIRNGKYEEGVGGGVSQVATTVFNAAWEAGLKITARAAHDLYISRYPLGRDATVNYPDLDLRFVNDTRNSLFVDATAGETGISVAIYGAPTGRRVVSRAEKLLETAPPPLQKVLDPTLYEGDRIVVDDGEPARSITVTRTVYTGDRVLYRETWTTHYRAEPRIVRVGTLARPSPPPPPSPAAPPPPPAQPRASLPPPPPVEKRSPPEDGKGEPAPTQPQSPKTEPSESRPGGG